MLKSRMHRISACTAVAFLLLAPLIASCDNKSAAQYIRDAEADRAAGKISAAIIDVKNALQKDPKNLSARVLLAHFYLELPDPIGAEAELLRARQDGVDASVIAKPLAEAELMLGKPQLAMKETEIADTAAPELKASLLAVRGSALMAIGDMGSAQSTLEAALKASSHSVDALAALTRFRLVQGDLPAAHQSLDEAKKIEPKNATLLSLEGDVDFAGGDAVASEQAFQEMLMVASWSLPARVGVARAQIAENKLREAAANLDTVLRSAPHDPNTNYLRALAAYRDSDFTRAETHIQWALSATKNSPPVLLLGGAIAYASKQYQQANALLGQYVYLVPNNLQARKLLAASQVALGHSAEAAKTLVSGIEQGAVDPQLLAMIGEASARSGDLVSARHYLSMAVERTPNDVPLRTQLGLTELNIGETGQGIEELEKASRQDPEALRPQIALFVAYLRNQDFDKALEIAEQVRKDHPNEAVGFDLVGIAQLQKKDFEAARTAFLKARDLKASDPDALKMLALLEVRSGNLSSATQYYQEILKYNPKDIEAYIGLAQLEAQSGHPEQTQATLEAAIQQAPDNPLPRTALGRFFLGSRKNQEAINVIEPALAKNPNEPALLEVIGQAQFGLGNYDAAIAAFRALTEAQPQSVAGHRYLAETYATAGNLDTALAEARRAVELGPNDAPAKFTLARVYLAQKDFVNARRVADDLATQLPQDATVAELQASIALADGRSEDAISGFKRALAISDTTSGRSLLATAQAKAGHLSDAENTLLSSVAAHPEDGVARMALGDFYFGLDRFADAETQYAAVLEKNPNNTAAENNLAWVMAANGETAPALARARHAATMAPQAPEVLDTLGVILLQNGKTDEAVETLRKAVAARPQGDPEIKFHLVQSLIRAGNKDDARENLRTLLSSEQPFKDRTQAEKLLTELGG
jgi:putative PEP-CTERM system TPR-repeat lipoprotein